MAGTEYKWVGTHVQDLADGRMLAVGDVVELTGDEVRENQVLIDDGGLISVTESAKAAKQTAAHNAKEQEGASE